MAVFDGCHKPLTPSYGTSHDEHVDLERISVDQLVMGGAPCVAGTRIPVATVVGSIANGLVIDEILAEYPQLTRDDIQACLAYTTAHGGGYSGDRGPAQGRP
jgi:uncharacterized protein (DUF433 family)